MKTEFKQEVKVLSSRVGLDLKINIVNALNLFQDNMCEYFKNLGCDGPTMIPIANCFFVVAKTKLHIIDSPKWLDTITLKTNISKLSAIRLNLFSSMLSDSNIGITCLQEMCAMDSNTRKIRTVDSTLLPKDIDVELVGSEIGFTKLNECFDENDLVCEVKIKSSNIDMYRHTNNVQYAEIILDTFSIEEIERMQITDFEIHYINECKYGDIIRIYRKCIDNVCYFELKCGESIISKAMLKH